MKRYPSSNKQSINLYRIKERYDKKAKSSYLVSVKARQNFSDQLQIKQAQAITDWYRIGGEFFLEWVKAEYRTWDGHKMQFEDPFFEELILAIGNPWISKLVVQKGAQMGWTETCIALKAWLLTKIRIPCAFGVEQSNKLRDLVGPRFQLAFDKNLEMQKLINETKTITGRADIDTKDRNVTVAGVPLTFFYCKTAASARKNKQTGDTREASSALSSFTSFFTTIDEGELIPIEVIEVLDSRSEGSFLPTRPVRVGSTPGGVGGTIDSLQKDAEFIFQWTITCPGCGKAQFLNPKGNLFKPVIENRDGRLITLYFDRTGRPMKWLSSAPESATIKQKIQSAYIGCKYCSNCFSTEVLKSGAFYQNRDVHDFESDEVGISLRNFMSDLTASQLPATGAVFIYLPKLASRFFNVVSKVGKLITNHNTAVVLQEEFGLVSEESGGQIAVDALKNCIGLGAPEWVGDRKPNYVVAGIDQGNSAHWLLIEEWYFKDIPKNTDHWEEAWLDAYVKVVAWKRIAGLKEAVDEAIQEYGIDLIGCDLKPEVTEASDLSRRHPIQRDTKGQVFLFRECNLERGEKFKEKTTVVQLEEIQVTDLHRSFGMDSVRNRIYRHQFSVPQDFVYSQQSDNFLYHLSTSERLDNSSWLEPAGSPDHGHHCASFCEAVVFIHRYSDEYKPFVYGKVSLK